MKLIIAGGGTGGHIYPALAIADAVKAMDPRAQVDFVGTPRGLEGQLVPRSGYPLHMISVGRLNRNVGWAEQLKTLLQMPRALWQACRLLRQIKPDVVLGVGGYASGPVVLMAALMRFRVLIWEPNAYPGLANRLLAPFVSQCLVVFSAAQAHLRNKNLRQVGMPVRSTIEAFSPSKKSTSVFSILMFGGSQGARSLNHALAEAVLRGGEWLEGLKIVHQTGAADFVQIREIYRQSEWAKKNVEVQEYLHDMPERYQVADLVISRAGTGTISELAACEKAALLIPLPTAADDHQTRNAQALVEKRAARLLLQKDLTPERLIKEIITLKNNPDERQLMQKSIKEFHSPDAARSLAEILIKG